MASASPSSAFACLDAPPAPLVDLAAERVALLPRCCGTYCLYDSGGRLLYVGKARDLRVRVRCHLRALTGDGYLAGWTRRIARIEARPAGSELEALLVEAELIRRLRPPFNLQMRLWARYCYIAGSGENGVLVVHRRRPRAEVCFGPYRSVGQARAIVEALGGHGGEAGWRAALAGVDDSVVRALESEAEARSTGRVEAARGAMVLRGAFEQAALLREAEGLVGGLLVMPGDEGMRRVAFISDRGLRFEVLCDDTSDGTRIVEWRRSAAKAGGHPGRLRRNVADSFRLIVRHLRSSSPACQLIEPDQLRNPRPAVLPTTEFRPSLHP